MSRRSSRLHQSGRSLRFVLAAFVFLAFVAAGLALDGHVARAAAADTQPPTTPPSLSAVESTVAPFTALLWWGSSTDDVGVAGYAIYVATSPGGPFVTAGRTDGRVWGYKRGEPGVSYHFRVTAYDAAGNESGPASAGPVSSVWSSSPHRTYTASTISCAACHDVHTAAVGGGGPILRQTGSSLPSQLSICYACHDGQGADTNVRTGSANSFALSSGHSMEATGTGDLTNYCSSCHNVHGDPQAGSRMLPAGIVNGVAVTRSSPDLCLACHDAANSWYGAGYPQTSAPIRGANGYPVAGTWPGKITYEASTTAHSAIPETTVTVSSGSVRRARGDCLYCHASHRGPNDYDALVDIFVPPTASTLTQDQTTGRYAAVCLQCHGGVTPSGMTTTTDIKQFITAPDTNAGHRVKTAGGLLPVGAPLPCYECHNPHGSKRGNSSMISDVLGAGLKTGTSLNVRRFCFSCHVTADTSRGWDSTTSTFTAPPTGAQVVGIDRTAGSLHLPSRRGHNQTDAQSCYQCHGKSYGAGGTNVHNPGEGPNHLATSASQECLDCHQNPDVATLHPSCPTCHNNPTYPTLPTGKTPECLSCHNGTDVGTHAYTPADPNHYTAALHTPSDPATFTAAYQGSGFDGIVPAGGEECANCHSAEIKPAHATTSTSGGSVTCVECHTNTSLGATAVISGDWTNDRCTDCHDTGAATTHDTFSTTHVVQAGTCAGTGASCHNTVDLSVLHANSQAGGAPKYQTCYNVDPADPTACHNRLTPDSRPAAFDPVASCGEGTTGCHQDKTVANHAGAGSHVFTAASDYNNTTLTGCTNSGAGCHGAETTYSSFVSYHPNSGCINGACHTSPSKATYTGDHECASCHDSNFTNAPDVIGLTTGHYSETTHTAVGLDTSVTAAGGASVGGVVAGGASLRSSGATVTAGGSASATCVDCHDPVNLAGPDQLFNQHQGVSSGSLTCSGCHNSNVAVSNIVKNGWTTRDCAACHNATVLPTAPQHALTAPSVEATGVGTYQGVSCSDPSCHGTINLHQLHRNAVSGCSAASCHDFTSQGAKPTKKSCGAGAACHTTDSHTPNHVATVASQECLDCHQNSNISTLHPTCATCHGNPSYPGLPVGKTAECTNCHNGVDVGTHQYTPANPNHYAAVLHTPSAPATFTAAYQATGPDGTVPSGGRDCSACHSAELPVAHSNTSASGGSVTCAECHTNASLESTTTIAGNWPTDRCTDCHDTGAATTHDTYGSAHIIDPGTCGGTGSSCHNYVDLAQLHDSGVSGGPPKYAGCANSDPTDPSGCHNTLDARPGPINPAASCGQGTAGCHQDKNTNNHGAAVAHPFSAASDYSATTDTGCTNSGTGCHGTESTYSNFTNYHPATGCYAGACHTSPSEPTWAAGAGPDKCASCHDANFTNAPDAVSIKTAHYNETTHTASGLNATVISAAGGTVSAACTDCHNPTNLSGNPNQLYNQHRGLPAPLGDRSCQDCHNASPLVTGVIQSSWAGARVCTACHNATTLPGFAQHDTTAPVVTGSSTDGCVAFGCHSTWNLHELHKGKTGGKVTTCALSGCHDFTKQGTKPTSTTCGTGGACHTTDPHAANHVASTSQECVDCHESGDVTQVHTAGCPTCHANPTYPALPTGKTPECIDCHNGIDVGTHSYSPPDSAHYDPAQLKHIATGQTGTESGYACTQCHALELKPAHNGPTSIGFTLGSYPNKCVACHELRVDNLGGAWVGTCTACHTTALHGDKATKHDASAEQLPQPGSAMVPAVSATVETEDFGTTTTWPVDYTRSNATYVTNQTGSAHGGAAAQIGVNTTRTEYNFFKDIDLTGYSTSEMSFWYQLNVSSTADYLLVDYSTDGGTNWTQLFRQDTDALTWSQAATSTAMPAGGVVRLRFRGTANATGEYVRVDDIKVVGNSSASTQPLPVNSTAAVSCMNNPNGTECHNVTDVAALHDGTTARCTACHKDASTAPTLGCQTTGCHAGVNLDEHVQTGTGTPVHHESGVSDTAVFGASFAGSWCTGCHDDSIANEHFGLGSYSSAPCSVCHKKTVNSGAPTNVTVVDAQSTIAKAAGTALCTDCHKTVTKTAPHVQRAGDGGTPGTQFDDTWSGHKVYDTGLGSGTSFANVQGATRTWSLPTATSWLKTGWTTTTMAVRCSDCHGSVTGAAGPHGASMTVNVASGYDNSYSSGTLTLSGTSMSNTTNICAKCHTTTGMGYNNVHSQGNHSGQACIACHTKTAHAWKRPRLIGYTTDPAPYRTTQVTSIRAKNYTPTGWQKTDCGAACDSGTHPTITSPSNWP